MIYSSLMTGFVVGALGALYLIDRQGRQRLLIGSYMGMVSDNEIEKFIYKRLRCIIDYFKYIIFVLHCKKVGKLKLIYFKTHLVL